MMDRMHELEATIEQELESMDYELVDLQCSGGSAGKTILIKVDRTGGLTIRDCEIISRDLEPLLDDERWELGDYRLEVSSPGLERPLKKREDFERFRGERIAIRTKHVLEGRRNYRGILKRIEAESLYLEIEGQEVIIPFDEINKAHLIFEDPIPLRLVKS